MHFRYDINAMRALAVAGVVLYHFGIPGANSGFAGVDVFFVISGYLMTSIIFSKIELNKFSLKNFYIDRIRRIFPALIVICFALMAFGFYYMGADIYRLLGKHVKYSLRFMSNIGYLRESGYFDSVSQEKWLLHTWSLSVEWQFYMLYPIFILGLKRFINLRSIKVILVIITFISFLLCLYYANIDQSKAFYLLQFRAWEMLVGGLIFLYPININNSYKPYLSLIGIIIIVVSFTSNLSIHHWPGYYTLIPVLGSALVLIAGSKDLWIYKNIVFQFLGKTSYSLYIWHWPIFAGLYYFEVNHNLNYTVAGLVSSLVLACLSYKLVEMPFANKNNKKLFLPLIIAFICCYAASAMIVYKDGLPNRFSDGRMMAYDLNENRSKYQERCMPDSGHFEYWCLIDESKPVDLIAIGDSHSDSIITSISEGLEKNVQFISYSGCLTIPGLKRTDMKANYMCGDFAEQLMNEIKKIDPHIPLVMTNRLSGYLPVGDAKPVVYFDKPYDQASQKFYDEFTHKYITTVCELTKSRQVYIVLPLPEMKVNVPKVTVKNNILGIKDKDVYITLDEYHERHNKVRSIVEKTRDECGVIILEPEKYLCSEGKCWGTHNNTSIYYDDNHLSEYGNKLLTPMFNEIWSK